MTWFKEMTEKVMFNAQEWLKENYEDYEDFSYAYEDMVMDDSVTGNASGRWSYHNDYYAEQLIWDGEFIDYLDNYLGYDFTDVIAGGKETVVVLACFFIIDFCIFEELEEFFNKLKS